MSADFDALAKAMRAAYDSGLSMGIVARQFGVTESVVRHRLIKSGTAIRTGNHRGPEGAQPRNRAMKSGAPKRACLGCGAAFQRTAARWFQCQPCAARTDV